MAVVLVADDDADHRELLALTLGRAGHDVVHAADAASAMSTLRAGRVDAALIDVRMPGESGIELCRRLRAEPAGAVLPVMLISGDATDHGVVTALHAGADDFVAKPFHRADLCARLENLMLRKAGCARRAALVAMLAAHGAVRAPAMPERQRRTA